MMRSCLLCAAVLAVSACQDARRSTAPDAGSVEMLDGASAAAIGESSVIPQGTSAVVDGRMTVDEWADAVSFSFGARTVEGGTVPARLFLKHDGTNLFLAVRYERRIADAADILFEFDNDNDGISENGDDALVYSQLARLFADDVRTNQSPPCPPDSPPAFCAPSDTDVGGTVDGAGAFSIHDGFSVYEVVHPLNSGDAGHDFAVGVGSEVGMWMQVQMASGNTLVSTRFPTHGYLSLSFCCASR